MFTRVFVQEARKPGASIIDVLGDTEELVVKIASSVIDRSTGQPYEQQPAIRNEAGQRVKFCFFSANGQCGFAAFATNAASSRADAEEEAYALAKTKNSRVAWQALLNAYPNGRYAPVAAIALSEGTVSFSAPPQPLRFPSNGYSKVSNAGAPLSDNAHLGDAATDWACTRDNASGLTWEVKTSLGLRSSIHTYTWFDSQGNASAKDSPSGGSCWKAGRCDTERYTRDVNSVGLCGARDWRMPTADELKGLVRQSRTSPMIDQSFVPNTVSLDYWSSSPDPYDSSAAWSVYFANGSANSYSFRSSPYSVRLVRAGP